MRVFILDRPGKVRDQVLQWLSEDKKLTRIEVFEDCIRFIEEIEKSRPHFSIIRLGNDGISGLKTADLVREISPDMRIVFIADDRDYAIDAYEIGAYGYLLYPASKEQFENALREKA